MDEQFKKAQKPWSKLLLKVNKTKADYHAACKAEKTAVNIERNAGGDSSLSQDHVSFIKLLKTCNLDMFSSDNYDMIIIQILSTILNNVMTFPFYMFKKEMGLWPVAV